MKNKKLIILTFLTTAVILMSACATKGNVGNVEALTDENVIDLSKGSKGDLVSTNDDEETTGLSETKTEAETKADTTKVNDTDNTENTEKAKKIDNTDNTTTADTKKAADTTAKKPVNNGEATKKAEATTKKSEKTYPSTEKAVTTAPKKEPTVTTSVKEDKNTQTTASETTEPAVTTKAPTVEETTQSTHHKTAAPDFTVYDEAGNEVSLSDYIGKPIVLNFWATWCGPCQNEMPGFNEKYLELGDSVQFLMINLTDGQRDTVESVSAFIAEKGYSFPVLYDKDYDAVATYGISSIPTTYFIDSEGYLVAWAKGAIDIETLQTGIDMIS